MLPYILGHLLSMTKVYVGDDLIDGGEAKTAKLALQLLPHDDLALVDSSPQ